MEIKEGNGTIPRWTDQKKTDTINVSASDTVVTAISNVHKEENGTPDTQPRRLAVHTSSRKSLQKVEQTDPKFPRFGDLLTLPRGIGHHGYFI